MSARREAETASVVDNLDPPRDAGNSPASVDVHLISPVDE